VATINKATAADADTVSARASTGADEKRTSDCGQHHLAYNVLPSQQVRGTQGILRKFTNFTNSVKILSWGRGM